MRNIEKQIFRPLIRGGKLKVIIIDISKWFFNYMINNIMLLSKSNGIKSLFLVSYLIFIRNFAPNY